MVRPTHDCGLRPARTPSGMPMATVDDAAREKLLQEASKLAMGDYGIIPLHFEVTPWAFKKGLNYRPRVDQYTLAFEVQQVGS